MLRGYTPDGQGTGGYSVSGGVALSTLVTGLVAYWSLDETSGTRADSVGDMDLTDNNTVTYDTGKNGNSAKFDVLNSESLTIADNATLSLGTDSAFTIAGWSSNTGANNLGMVCKWGGAGNERDAEYVLLTNATTNKAIFWVGNGTDYAAASADVANIAQLNFYVAWHDPDANKIYVQVNDETPAEAAWAGGTQDGDGVFAIGKAGTFNSYFWTGLIDEVGIWFRVLTADERAELYNSGTGKFYNGTNFV